MDFEKAEEIVDVEVVEGEVIESDAVAEETSECIPVEMMNVLVLGNSGAGKSTLIRAISGAEVETGIGEGLTKEITPYVSKTWPIRCIDTMGLEFDKSKQRKVIKQVKQFTKSQLKEKGNDGIDAVWYCVEGTSKRIFQYNIEMMSKTIKSWKNVPVFVAITKSFSEIETEENINAVKEAFAKCKDVNLQKIIPVVAETYKINEETIVEPKGVDALCLATLDCMDEAKKISEENKNRMILEQKRFSANLLTGTSTTMGVAIGAIPIPFPDSTILVPLEIALTKGILKIYGIETKGDLIAAIVGSTTISEVARATLGAVTKVVPNLASSALNAVVAGFFITALGESVIALSEAVCTGKIDVEKIDNVVKFVSEKLKENPVFEFVVSFFEEHPELIQGKSAKEIFGLILGAFKNSKKQ